MEQAEAFDPGGAKGAGLADNRRASLGRVQLQAKRAAWRIDVGWLTGQVKLSRAEAEP